MEIIKKENLFDLNKLDNDFTTNLISDLRVNENIGTTNEITSIINTELNQVNYNLNLKGYGNNNISNNNFIISNEKDNDGFFKTIDLKIKINKNDVNNSNRLKINQILPYSNIKKESKEFDFYIEDIKSLSNVSNVNVSLLNNYTIDFISGVPTFIDGNLNVNLIAYNLTNNFLRHDKKHLDLVLKNNNNIFGNPTLVDNDYIKNQNFLL